MYYSVNDEIGTVVNSLNKMLKNMRESLGQVLDTSNQVSVSASHLRTASEQIA
jgi:methyl-accepting chemotaxis protein